jgi:hypothetical protein
LTVSCGSCGTPPWTPPDGHRVPDMLWSPSGFRLWVSQAIQEPPSEFLPAAPGIQRSASRRTPVLLLWATAGTPLASMQQCPQLHFAHSPHRLPNQADSITSSSDDMIDSVASSTSTTMPPDSTDEVFGAYTVVVLKASPSVKSDAASSDTSPVSSTALSPPR